MVDKIELRFNDKEPLDNLYPLELKVYIQNSIDIYFMNSYSLKYIQTIRKVLIICILF